MSRDRLAEDLVATALELHKKRLWLKLAADEGVFVEVPTQEFPVLATAMGHAGDAYGVIIYLGEHAFDCLVRCLRTEAGDHELTSALDYVGVTIEPLREIPPYLRAPLEAAGFVHRRDVLAPMFASKRANRAPKSPNRTELKTILWVLKALLATDASGELQPPSVFSGKVMTIRATGELKAPDFVTRISKAPAIRAKPVTESPVTFPAHLKNLPILDTTWIVGLPLLPAVIHSDKRAMCCCLIIDDDSAEIVKFELVPDGNSSDVARILTGEFLDPQKGARLPKRIHCASESLYQALSEPLRRLGIKVELEVDNPKFRYAVEAMLLALISPPLGRRKPRRKPRVDVVPEDLADLQDADSDLKVWLGEQGYDLVKDRAVDRYFGPYSDDPKELLDEFADHQIHAALFEWLLADYRPTKTSKSHIEKLLNRKALPAVDRLLLESRLGAEISIWRVDSLDPGLTITVECVLSGLRRTIHDRPLSSSASLGEFIPLRVLKVGNFFWAIAAGPPIPPIKIDDALNYLRELEPDLSPSTLKQRPELLGYLWSWCPRKQMGPLMRNTDGHVIAPIRAFFNVSDIDALVQALDSRNDIEVPVPNAEWVWVKDEPTATGVDVPTILGQLDLMGDELVLTVNSAERLEQARSWLERIRGVRFKSMRERSQVDIEPLDDRLPKAMSSPPPQEVLDQVGAMFHRMCMSWLDEKIPALGGKTPREACATEAGRRQVATLIRTYPQPMGMGLNIDVPREAMLKELGLDS